MALVYLVAITAAEIITAVAQTMAGIVFHVVLLLALVAHSSLSGQRPEHKLYLTLALAPLIRILSLSMPLAGIPQIYWYMIIAVPLLGAAFVVSRQLGLSRRQVGLVWNRLPVQLLIASSGLLFGLVEYYILRPKPLADALSPGQIAVPALILLVGTGFTEEVTFRGVVQCSATQVMGRWGWLYVAVLFAVLHTGYLLVSDVLFVLVVGAFFGRMVLKTGSLLGVTLSHGITNILLYLVFPFLF